MKMGFIKARFFTGKEYNSGVTTLEILITAVMAIILAAIIIPWQAASWKRTNAYSRVSSACHQVERQIEQRRIWISTNPDVNYAIFKTMTDTTILDTTTRPPIRFKWEMTDAKDYKGNTIPTGNVRQVAITIYLGPSESFVVNTCIAKNF